MSGRNRSKVTRGLVFDGNDVGVSRSPSPESLAQGEAAGDDSANQRAQP
jgi:hypothetical protein